MKASNPKVMIQAYRLLTAKMYELGWDYPLHLGVTEAGDGEDGRIKSAIGIGSLLLDGLGDTIRVSLTEDPWYEIDPCIRLIELAKDYENRGVEPFAENYRTIDTSVTRKVTLPNQVGFHRDGSVIASISAEGMQSADFYQTIGCVRKNLALKPTSTSCDSIVVDKENVDQKIKDELHTIGIGILQPKTLTEVIQNRNIEKYAIQVGDNASNIDALIVDSDNESDWHVLRSIKARVIFWRPQKSFIHSSRCFFEWLADNHINTPVIFNFRYNLSKEDFIIRASAECGSLFCDGLGDGLWLQGPYEIDFIRRISFNILQSTRKRIIKTDFISCPSCGRTLFNLQEVTQRIKKRTEHLKGVKIAIMGCIVNGPGEMADADFGYVGSKPGKIDLYVGKEKVEKNIDFFDADDRLVELIKSHGRWEDLPTDY